MAIKSQMANSDTLPPLNALAAFSHAARCGGFTQAAKSLGVAQPSITRHVALLEDWLGVRLFDRGVNSAQLTSAGKILAQSADKAFDELRDTVQQLRQTGYKSVVLGCSISVTHLWLLPRLAGLNELDPKLDLSLFTAERYRDYYRNNVDLSIRFGIYSQGVRIIPEYCVPLASPEFAARHNLSAQSSAKAFKAAWLLCYDEGNYDWLTWDKWFALQNIPAPSSRLVGHYLNYPLLIERARAGEGVVLGTRGLVQHFIDSGALMVVGPQVERPDYGYYLLNHHPNNQDVAIATVMRWLSQQ
ncbi:MAG: DNA-binding transcriptional LysR family regulator [Oceanospirillaceae bacterium]|jgi:DNA-binding transcriptional LysR family regulator